MPTNFEIERKFVVNSAHPEWIALRDSIQGQRLIQSTIHKESGYKLRIRMIEDIATWVRSSFFCFKVTKKKWDHTDPSMRDEYEWPVQDRNALYMMIGHGEISKLRRDWVDPTWTHWSFDTYEGPNAWIITADAEVTDPKQEIMKPSWCGWEVTADERLKNASLQDETKAFSTWSEENKLWYKTLEVGEGISVYPVAKEEKVHKRKSFWKRLRKAWKILAGKEE